MKTILSKLFSFIVEKPRLFIEYLLIGCIMFFAAICVKLWMENVAVNARITQNESRYAELHSEHLQTTAALKELIALRKKDQDSYHTLANEIKKNNEEREVLMCKLDNLEATNGVVKAYLNERVPDDLRRMLDNNTDTGATNSSNN